MKSERLYRAYIREKDHLEEADTKWGEEITGTGEGIAELARESIALVAMNDTYQAEDLKACVNEWAELCVMLEDHLDEQVVVYHNEVGGWEIKEYTEEQGLGRKIAPFSNGWIARTFSRTMRAAEYFATLTPKSHTIEYTTCYANTLYSGCYGLELWLAESKKVEKSYKKPIDNMNKQEYN